MNYNLYFLIGGFVLLWILINLIIYLFNRHKHNIFLNYIHERKYTIVKDVETETEGYSKFGSKITYRKSDIIFLDEEIFILRLNKPIIQLSKSDEISPSIFYKFKYNSKVKINDRLQIKNSDESLKVNLNFKNKDFDVSSILLLS